MLRTRRRRAAEEGQVLLLALAFIAFFGLLVGAVLSFGGVTGLQHVHTEKSATRDGLAEGGAAYAAADATRTDIPLTCSVGATGAIAMQSGDSASYTIHACNPGNTQGLSGGSSGHCLLCILNKTPSTVASTVVFSANRGVSTTGGDDYINGSIASGTTLTVNPTTSAHLRVLNGANTSGCTCTPALVNTYPQPIADPLLSVGAPSTVAGRPTGCTSYDTTKGCTASFSGQGSSTINPGLWSSLSISGKASVTATSGVYVFTGGLSVSGQGNFTATKVTFYLACPNYGTTGKTCTSGSTGGNISFSGNGTVSVTAPGSTQYTNVNGSLLGADVAILADPNLLDPSGVTSCLAGTGCLYNVAGNGASITGSVDLRGGGMAIAGNGGQTMTSGLLITNSLSISISGSATSGLSLSGPGTISSTGSCGVFDDTVSGTGSSGASPGHAIIQSGCGNGAANGVVDFNYGP